MNPSHFRVAIYVRVSTTDQSVEPQLLDLKSYAQSRGWTVYRGYIDHGVSGTKERRPALDSLMADARKRRFDTVLVWRFDRFARSTKHLILALEEFRHLGIGFVSFQENVDTSSPLGSAIFVILGAVAQLEKDIIRERVKMGLRRARTRGKKLGRPRAKICKETVLRLAEEGYSQTQIGKMLGVSRMTIARHLRAAQKPSGFHFLRAPSALDFSWRN